MTARAVSARIDVHQAQRQTARVQSASRRSLFVTRKLARRGAAALAVLLGLWMFAFASHVHAHEDGDDHGRKPAACTFCLSLPTAAPTPHLTTVAISIFIEAAIAVPEAIGRGNEVNSSYLSRGPPAY